VKEGVGVRAEEFDCEGMCDNKDEIKMVQAMQKEARNAKEI